MKESTVDIFMYVCTFMQMKESFPAARFFKALADPNRMRILQELCSCEEAQSVSEMGRCCDVDLSVLSRHLAQLRDAGIVTSKKDGRHVRYLADAGGLAKIFRDLADALEECANCGCEPNKPKTKGETP